MYNMYVYGVISATLSATGAVLSGSSSAMLSNSDGRLEFEIEGLLEEKIGLLVDPPLPFE